MTEPDAEVTELVSSLKQLLISFSPMIQEAGSAEDAEDAILHMEERDGNFHRYDYVKRIRAKIENCLSSLIDEEIEKHSIGANDITAGQETVVSKINTKIQQSAEFRSLTEQLQSRVSDACNVLINNFDAEFATDGSNKSTLGRPNRRNADVIFSEDEDSSLYGSSSHPSDVLFMGNDHFQKIAEKLDKKRPLEIRQEAICKLLQVLSMDIQNADVWLPITQGLQDALCDPDQMLWSSSLKFLARGMSANTQSTKDLYTTLVQFLAMQFNSVNKGNIPKMQSGLDCQKPEIVKLVKGFRLMNEYQQEIPQFWVRYPDKFVDDIVESTLSLLATPLYAPSPIVSPGHILALLDPRAVWFRRWMHGHYSRAHVLKNLERHKMVLENAVKSCLDYAMNRKIKSSENNGFTDTTGSGDKKSFTYTGDELEFVYFVNSLCIFGRLLCYKEGRKFFPVKVKDREEPVSVTKLVVSLIHLLTSSSCVSVPQRGPAGEFDAFRLVADLLKRLSSSESVCQQCICKDEVTDTLLDPIAYWLDGQGDSGSMPAPSDASMLHVADVLSQMASNSCGRRHLLYGETGQRFTKSKSAPVHILSDFAKKAISGTLGSEYSRHPSLAVVGNILFVCRQLYSSAEGLHVTYPYDLHTAIAVAWKVACHEADRGATPTPSSDGQEYWGSTANIVLWEDMLKDNLLNFSWTPKGLLLLQQAGAISECVSYMYTRYSRKQQVSKYEKYGYGYMMSQVASITAGIGPLQQTGFLTSLLRNIWSSLEAVDDCLIHVPRPWSVNAIDKHVKKLFNTIANLLSSYCAVSEVLGGVALPTKDSYTFREVPETLAAFLDRVVFIDSEAKIHSLFNYEQTHVFGLRLLSIMTSCLDSFLLLQTQYNVLGALMDMQKENTTEDSSEIILDMLSVERNYLLVKCHSVGGPSERILPPRTLNESKPEVFSFPLFSNYPLPKEYVKNISAKPSGTTAKQDSELSKILSSSGDQSASWMEKCRRSFCSLLTSRPEHAKGTVLQDLLEKVTGYLATLSEQAIFPLLEYTGTDVALKNIKLTPVQKLGIETALRYGAHLKLINNNSDTKDKLTLLLKKTTLFMKQQQRTGTDSQQRTPSRGGFDWFLASVFLLMHGDGEKAWRFLHKFSALAASAYLWYDRMHGSVHLPPSLQTSGIPVPLFSSSCHQVEYILQAELYHVYTAFRMSGYSPAQICQHWIRQCFWNYLDLLDICHYVAVCLALGVDYQVYVCVAILRHKQKDILHHCQEKNLLVKLKEEPLRGFKVGENLEYMQQLENKYRKMVLADMLNVSRH